MELATATPILGALGKVSEAVSFEEIPKPVMEHAKLVLFHNLLVALAGREAPVVGQDGTIWPDGAPRSATATRLTDGMKGPAGDTVFTNSLLMGARAQHDEYPHAFSHFGSAVLPALLAIAEQTPLTGREFLVAMINGYEIGAAIGTASAVETTHRGFRPTGLYGPFAAAAACAKALQCDQSGTQNALALAASSSAGITQVWLRGTDEWLYQTAAASRNGYVAAKLAARGARGAPDVLEGAKGFYSAFAGRSVESAEVLENLGRPWAMGEVRLKPYPICAMNQAPVQVAIHLQERHQFHVEEIDDVIITLHPTAAGYPGVDATGKPSTSTAAMMSLQFCMAVALLHGQVEPSHLSNTEDEAVLGLAGRVRLDTDPAITPSHAAAVQVRLGNGTEISSGPARDVQYNRQDAHALSVALLPATGMSRSEMEDLEEFVFTIDACDDAAQIIQRCLPRGA